MNVMYYWLVVVAATCMDVYLIRKQFIKFSIYLCFYAKILTPKRSASSVVGVAVVAARLRLGEAGSQPL